MRTYLNELKEKLRYKRIVSVVAWCEKNQVSIHKDLGTNRRFVFTAEFNSVYERGLNKTITQTYSAMNLTYEYLMMQKPSIYVPKGEKETLYLAALNSLKKQP